MKIMTNKVKLIEENISTEDDGIGGYEYWGSYGYDSKPYLCGYVIFEFFGTKLEACDFVEEGIWEIAKQIPVNKPYFDDKDVDIFEKNNKIYIIINFTAECDDEKY